jgi:hypothetical protein
MKRLGRIWPAVTSFENLLRAYRKARKGKQSNPAIAEFSLNLESELLSLQQDLSDFSYQPGSYRLFIIYERKKRQIAAASIYLVIRSFHISANCATTTDMLFIDGYALWPGFIGKINCAADSLGHRYINAISSHLNSKDPLWNDWYYLDDADKNPVSSNLCI